MLPASPRQQGVSVVCTPQRYQGFDPTFHEAPYNGAEALIRHFTRHHTILYTRGDLPVMHHTNVAVLADNDRGTPKKLVFVAVAHHIPWATAWAGLSKHVGGLMGTVDVVVVVAVVRHITWAAVRPGPSNQMGLFMGRAERPISSPHLMGLGPGRARPINMRRWAGPSRGRGP